MDNLECIAATMQNGESIEHNTCNHDGQLIVAIRRSAIAYAGILHLSVSEDCGKQDKWVTSETSGLG